MISCSTVIKRTKSLSIKKNTEDEELTQKYEKYIMDTFYNINISLFNNKLSVVRVSSENCKTKLFVSLLSIVGKKHGVCLEFKHRGIKELQSTIEKNRLQKFIIKEISNSASRHKPVQLLDL